MQRKFNENRGTSAVESLENRLLMAIIGVTNNDDDARVGVVDVGAYAYRAQPVSTNSAPTFTSAAPTAATAGQAFTYPITTTDPNGDSVSIMSEELPAWLALTDHGDGTATLYGTPSNDDAGRATIVLSVAGADGVGATQEVMLTVAAVNHAPTLDAQAAIAAVAFQPFNHLIGGNDVDKDDLTITVISQPGWLTVTDHHNGTATLGGVPSADDNGINALVVQVSDGRIAAQQTYTIDVLAQRWTLDDGILGVYGSNDADVINVWLKGTQLRVLRNGAMKNFDAADVRGIEIFGFDGDDFISANTRTIPVYALGHAHRDTLMGGDENDNFVGGGGKDVIDAGGGDDRLDGFNGNDRLIGGPGDDRILGGEGDDTLVGGPGADQLFGQAGNDRLHARDDTADLLDGGDDEDAAERDQIDWLSDLLAGM